MFLKEASCTLADGCGLQVEEKKYTEEHEWIELSEDGKTGMLPLDPTTSPSSLANNTKNPPHQPLH